MASSSPSSLTPKPAYWFIGPPGSGKSHEVMVRAKKSGAKILRIHARVDRSFRDGRPLLFAMHRASEPTLVWIEGADVLTPDAQAFLRRIIETCSKCVEFILETRDETRISMPIRSRCISVYFSGNVDGYNSYRQKHYNTVIKSGKLPAKVITAIRKAEEEEEKWVEKVKKIGAVKAIQYAREMSLSPYVLIQKVLLTLPQESQDLFRRALGSGRSIWALLCLACV